MSSLPLLLRTGRFLLVENSVLNVKTTSITRYLLLLLLNYITYLHLHLIRPTFAQDILHIRVFEAYGVR